MTSCFHENDTNSKSEPMIKENLIPNKLIQAVIIKKINSYYFTNIVLGTLRRFGGCEAADLCTKPFGEVATASSCNKINQPSSACTFWHRQHTTTY